MKKTTVTIGIPTYNEEQNIENILRSLMQQQTDTVSLQEIIVNSDASSDKTNAIVKRLNKKYRIITLIENKERKGKYFRVNQLFHKTKSDVLVILDADIALKGDKFLETLVTSLMADKKAVMTAAHVELIRPDGFFAKVMDTTFVFGDFMRLSVPGYDIAANFHGAATAYKKSFIQKVNIPTNLSDPHVYIYYMARKVKGFRYCMDAVILQNPAVTMKDIRQLMQRSIGKEDKELKKIFGKKMIHDANIIPKKAKIKGLIKCFLWQPFYTPLAVVMNYYFAKFARPEKVDKSPIWEINSSTKKPIIYAK